MFLIKCSCGCHFTVGTDAIFESRNLTCQNCRKSFFTSATSELRDVFRVLKENNFELFELPETTEIQFSFKP